MNDTQDRQNGNPFRLLMRVPVPWAFVLSYFVGVGLQQLLPHEIGSPEVLRVAGVAGAVLFAVGAVFATWSLLLFRKARTTTVPGRASAALVTQGPYRLSRNPMYVSLTLAYLGEAGILRQVWPLAVLPLTVAYVNWIVIPVEEGRLKEVFGAEYEQYRARVRRWI
jgi:protein-S-isoprenylcysteine O-methyltransferase Ste14